MSLTYLGHSAFKYRVDGVVIYTDPYYQEPVDWRRLEKGNLVLLTHGHFDHGVMMAPKLYEAWRCKFVAPRALTTWMLRKFKRTIPPEAIIPIDQGQTITVDGIKITAVAAHHPMSRIGKTMMALWMRSRAPGNPVLGYYFNGYYQSGDTIYTPEIARGLKGRHIHTACLPIGGKYKTANPQEALEIAEEIKATRIVPMHWQPLVEQVPFRYQPSHLVKLARSKGTSVQICPLAIGEILEDSGEHAMDSSALTR